MINYYKLNMLIRAIKLNRTSLINSICTPIVFQHYLRSRTLYWSKILANRFYSSKPPHSNYSVKSIQKPLQENTKERNYYQDNDDKQETHEFWSSKTNRRLRFGASGAALFGASFITFHHTGGGPPFDNNNNNNRSAVVEDLHRAVLEGDERRVKVLVKQCTPNDINTRHQLGWQMIHVAAVNGRSHICEILLEHGAKVNDIDHYSSPRLMSEQLNIDPLVIALIRDTDFNQDLARVNFYGCTPLHYAAISNSLETVQVLIKHGANPTIKNDLGFKPSNFGNQNVARQIMQYEEEYTRREKELEEEERRLFPLEKRIKEHIVGQDAAISMVAATIRRKENGWFDEDHPLVFLFLGSSGIGKTELAKQVAKYLHKDDKKAFIRLDMSEYQEQHSVSRMIGSPPGYVGHDDGGQLTDALKDCNNAVVLLDEVEKAHPKVLTVLLQLFDEGRMTDGKGRTIECKDAIFIMTSNLASEAIAEHALQLRAEQQLSKELKLENRLKDMFTKKKDDEEDYQEQITISRMFKDTTVRPILKAHFQRDEFLGRINEMVYFLPFSDSELHQLVTKELELWAARAKKKNNIEMTWDDKVIDVICKGYDVHYGARSIKHEVERRIINEISELHYTVKKAKKVHISVNNDPNSEGADLISLKIN